MPDRVLPHEIGIDRPRARVLVIELGFSDGPEHAVSNCRNLASLLNRDQEPTHQQNLVIFHLAKFLHPAKELGHRLDFDMTKR